MTDRTSSASRLIHAPPDAVFDAMVSARALERWRAPGDMTARMHRFEARAGGGYEMSLYYSDAEQPTLGRTKAGEDRFVSTFEVIDRPRRIVERIAFTAPDGSPGEEMTMEVVLREIGGHTEVTFTFKNLPEGISPVDNDEGTRSSLEKLAQYVEGIQRR